VSGAGKSDYRCGNHAAIPQNAGNARQLPMSKILIEFYFIVFEEKLRRIRIDFVPKRRGSANDSFSPIC
jgi:hypothetical protein